VQNNEIARMGGTGVFFDETLDIIIRGNNIHRMGKDGIHIGNRLDPNAPSNVLIESNKLYDSIHTNGHEDAMELWGSYNGMIIRYNSVCDFTQLIYISDPNDESANTPVIQNVQIYGNILYNDQYWKKQMGETQGIFIDGFTNRYNIVRNIVINSNTFGWLGYNPVWLYGTNMNGVTMWNNIFYQGASYISPGAVRIMSNYNLYEVNTLIPDYEGPNSIADTDPQFLNYNGQDSSIFAFYLKSTSPVIDKGNYIPGLQKLPSTLLFGSGSNMNFSIPSLLEQNIDRDITGHPRDIPDPGALEYAAYTLVYDFVYYISDNWLASTGKGDFNHDGITNFSDFAILADWWESVPDDSEYTANTEVEDFSYFIANNWLESIRTGDFNRDGIVDFIDFAILANRW
jgi:hypothetical protein